MDCCDVNGLNRIFRGKPVRWERRRFLKRGPNRRQQGFFTGLTPAGRTMLDLGCGVGGLGFTALRQGAVSATFVDISRAYLAAAREVAAELALTDESSFLAGDALALELPRADLVTLDRVVCCHPQGPILLAKAARLSGGALAFSYPLPRWYMRLGRGLGNGVLRLFGHPFRFYVHAEEKLLAAATSAGHELARSQRFGVWQLRVYRKG
jgi:magnesium-protoporphyrin O-methyltransferase